MAINKSYFFIESIKFPNVIVIINSIMDCKNKKFRKIIKNKIYLLLSFLDYINFIIQLKVFIC